MKKVTFKSYEGLPLMLSVPEMAAALGISRAGAYELVRTEGFPALKIGTRIVIPKDSGVVGPAGDLVGGGIDRFLGDGILTIHEGDSLAVYGLHLQVRTGHDVLEGELGRAIHNSRFSVAYGHHPLGEYAAGSIRVAGGDKGELRASGGRGLIVQHAAVDISDVIRGLLRLIGDDEGDYRA